MKNNHKIVSLLLVIFFSVSFYLFNAYAEENTAVNDLMDSKVIKILKDDAAGSEALDNSTVNTAIENKVVSTDLNSSELNTAVNDLMANTEANSSVPDAVSSTPQDEIKDKTEGRKFIGEGVVYIIPVKDTIEPGLAGFLKRSVKAAEEAKAACLIFEIDTFGGRVDSATEIRDLILDTKVPYTIAYINKRAISAGALIAYANKEIIMASGGTIGAAKPVTLGFGGSGMQPTDEKIVSYLRKEFRATAEKNGHPADIAEAFVDQDIEIEGITTKGKLVTLTTQECLKYKVASKKIDGIENLIADLNLEDRGVVKVEENWSEHLTRILTHPVLTSMLMTIGLLGIIVEIKTPGFGLPGMIGITAILIFFFAQHLVGLANYTDLLIFLLGVGLLAVEIFVIPGFGLAGVMGITLILVGLFMALVKRPIPEIPINKDQYFQGLYMLLSSLIFTGALSYVLFKFFLPKMESFGGLVLKTEEKGGEGFVVQGQDREDFLGREGVAVSSLRTAGKAMFGEELLDVVTDGEFLEKDTKIKVIEVKGNRIVVERIR